MKDLKKNSKENSRKERVTHIISRYLSFCILLFFALHAFGQNNRDSLDKDSKNDVVRAKLNNKDTSKGFVPVYDLVPEEDTFTVSNKKIPARASLYSAILPGMGQAYNGNYWKIPIIYSVFAGLYFLIDENNDVYQKFKTAYKLISDESISEADLKLKFEELNINTEYSKERIKDIKDHYKRNRDLDIILFAVAYLFNILDACVDAHLMDYDISDDLSLKVKPNLNLFQAYQKNSIQTGFGIKFVLSLHR